MITIHDDPGVVSAKPKKVPAVMCACGHQQGKHIELGGADGVMCDGARSTCRCREWKAVCTVPDARVFMYGPSAPVHPLTSGLLKLKEKGKLDLVVWTRSQCETQGCENEFAGVVYTNNKKSSELRCVEHGE